MRFIAREFANCDENNALNPRFWDNRLRAGFAHDLRSHYQETVDQPLPPRLSALLKQLERRLHSQES